MLLKAVLAASIAANLTAAAFNASVNPFAPVHAQCPQELTIRPATQVRLHILQLLPPTDRARAYLP